MTEYFLVANLILSSLLVPALTWIIRLERRITRLETKIEILCKKISLKAGDKD